MLSTGPEMVGNRNTTVVNALGTITGRVGFAWDRTLLYGKAGGAWASDKYRVIDLATGEVAAAANETRWGWVAGIGVERAFLDSWSVKIEYDYMDFGTKGNAFSFSDPYAPALIVHVAGNDRERMHIVRFGLNYRFGDYDRGPLK